MLDENLPTFFIKPSSDSEFQSTIYLGQGGHDLQPEYTVRRPDPNFPASKNCYAVALYDSYNPEILYAEVLVKPEWTQPTLSAAEVRAQNGVPPPPVPVVPNGFAIQLYNPDQQVHMRQIPGTWNASAHWEFEMPQQTFRQPSVSALDRSQSDPAAADTTPKVAFKWKRDSKLSKDITCMLAGKSTDGKKSKEPDIPIAMFTHGKEVTMYQPNMHRVEVEDVKGLEVVLLLGAIVIKDIFFNASRDTFNLSTATADIGRKNSGALRLATGLRPSSHTPVASGALPVSPDIQTIPDRSPRPYNASSGATTRLPTQDEIDAETARLLAIFEAEEKARLAADQAEQKRIKKMLEAEEKEQKRREEKERKRREAEVAKETERLRKQYGVEPVPDNFIPNSGPKVHFTPPLPNRPFQAPQQPPRPQQYGRPPGEPQFGLSPYSSVPGPRPSSVPPPQAQFANPGSWWGGYSNGAPTPQQQPQRPNNRMNSPDPSAQIGGQQPSGSSGGFFDRRKKDDTSRLLGIGIQGEGGRKKVTKKRSVYF